MKEIITGAIRYFEGRKSFIVFNISTLILGILVIVFAFTLIQINDKVNALTGIPLLITMMMIFFGFLVFYNFFLINNGLYSTRIKEFRVRILLGSGIRKIQYQIIFENMVQIFTATILALTIVDIAFSMIKQPTRIIFFEFYQNNVNYLIYILSFWIITSMYFVLSPNHGLKKLKPSNVLQPTKSESRFVGKVVLGLQVLLLNIIVLSWDFILPTISLISHSIYAIILVLGSLIVTFSLVVNLLYQTLWNKRILFVKKSVGAEFNDIIGDICRETSAILLLSALISVVVLIPIQLSMNLQWSFLYKILYLGLFNLVLAIIGRGICLVIMKMVLSPKHRQITE